MSKIDELLNAYERYVSLPWQTNLAGREKVWFAIYDPRDERRLRVHVPEFQLATQKADHGWALFDVTTAFEKWMAANEYRDSYFAQPELLSSTLGAFEEDLAAEVSAAMDSSGEDTVFAVLGVGSLFGIIRVSSLIERLAPGIRGRLLVFFPGTKHQNNYRLLDARDGWSYLAVPIEAEEKDP